MANPKKIKPIIPDPQDVSSLRRKLKELISRMQADYERYLKPLVLRMSKETRDRVSESNETVKAVISNAGDAVKFLTPFEVARTLRVLKSQVVRACQEGKIKNVVFNAGKYLIPEESVRDYGIDIGKINPQQELVDKFNDRVQKLTDKYNDLLYAYESMSRDFTEKMYRRAKKKFLSQFEKQVGIDILKKLSEKGLRDSFEKQVAENVDLIKSIPTKYFSQIRSMVIRSTTGGFQYDGGLQKAIMDMTGVTRDRASLIARDQSMKSVSTFTRLRFQNLGSKKYIWHNSRDKRVAGNPNGLYPDVDPKSKVHGDHWKREGKTFEWDNPPPDGNPGMGINCRCYAEPIFEFEENRD